jgi:hypothetical protein
VWPDAKALEVLLERLERAEGEPWLSLREALAASAGPLDDVRSTTTTPDETPALLEGRAPAVRQYGRAERGRTAGRRRPLPPDPAPAQPRLRAELDEAA